MKNKFFINNSPIDKESVKIKDLDPNFLPSYEKFSPNKINNSNNLKEIKIDKRVIDLLK